MQAIQPDQAVFLRQITLPALRNEHRLTRRILEAIPPEKADYRPDPIAKTAFDLAWHVAWVELVFLGGAASGEFNFGLSIRPDSVQSTPDILKWYAAGFESVMARLPELSGEQLVKVLDFQGLFQVPAVNYLQFAMHHSVHHRGQLSMYLRPMGAKVPTIYGESYDDEQARKASGTA